MKKILLVEDDSNLGYVIQDNLLLNGYKVSLCTDGFLGWNEFQKNTFDLCLLDVMLPKKDGFNLAKQIKTWVPASPPPISIQRLKLETIAFILSFLFLRLLKIMFL